MKPWTHADYARLGACATRQAAFAAFPDRSERAIDAARKRLRDGDVALLGRVQRRARGPETAQERAVWRQLEAVMSLAIREHRRIDWAAVLNAMRGGRRRP